MPILTKPTKTTDAGHLAASQAMIDRYNAMLWASDYPTIQAAIDACAAGRGGVVYLPPAIYTITQPILLPWRVSLVGAGIYSSVIQAAAPIAGPMVQVYGGAGYTNYTGLRDLGLDGNKQAQYGVEWNHASDNELIHVRIENCTGYGLYIHNSVWVCNASGCVIKNCGNGVYITAPPTTVGQVNLVTFDRCVISGNKGAGIHIYGGTSIKILCCDIEGNGIGGVEQYGILQTGGGQDLSVIDCHFERNGVPDSQAGVNVQIGKDGDEPALVPHIERCYFFGGHDVNLSIIGACAAAVQIENTTNAVVRGNRSWGHKSSMVQSGASNASPDIGGNVCDEAA